MRETVARTSRLREAMRADLTALGLTIPESFTNFLLIGFEDAEAACSAESRLRRSGLLMRAMGGYGLGHCLRATVAGGDAAARVRSVLEAGRLG